MTKPVIFLPPAEMEARAAAAQFEQIRPNLGVEFQRELQGLVDRLGEFPNLYQPFRGICRRAILHRFDYGVIYRVLRDRVEIVAVLHCRLNPIHAAARSEDR